MNKNYETRIFDCDLQTRNMGDAQKVKVIEGYFAKFYTIVDRGGWYEEMGRYCFNNFASRDVRALVNHNWDLPLGRTGNSTLMLRVDDLGLYGTIVINENDTEALNLYARVERGDVNQCSIGFNVLKEMREDYHGSYKFTVEEVDLFEVSACTLPAYENTTLEVRSNLLGGNKDNPKQKELLAKMENRK